MNPDMKVDLMHMTQYMKAVMKGVGWSIVRVGKGKDRSHWQALNRRIHITVYPDEILIWIDGETSMLLHKASIEEAIKRIKRKFNLD